MKWLEISLTVDGELAEAVADILSRYAHDGVALQMQDSGDDVETLSASKLVNIFAYLQVDSGINTKRAYIDQGLWHLSQIQPIPAPTYRFIEEEDWIDLWKANYNPIPVGEKLLILPAWYEAPEGKRRAIVLDPGMAFGTGLHPTTQLCLIAMENYLTPGDSVVDLGCGSGILSIAAILLGAYTVLALDMDPIAVQTAQSNIQRNGMLEKIRVEEGSLAQLLDDVIYPDSRDLLLANIYATILDELLDSGLLQAVKPQGTMILSGIMKHQVDEIQVKCIARGASILGSYQDGDWVALILQNNSSELQNSD